MAGGQINFKVGYTVDKTGLQAMKAALQEIQGMTANDLMGKGLATNIADADAKLKLAQQDAQTLSNILTQSFNKDLGTINIQKFNNALKTSNLDLNKVYTNMSAIGTTGVSAFRNMATQVLTTNLQLKKTHSLLDSMAETMGNTIKWGIASSIMNSFTGKVQEAYGYVKSLDSSLNNIRIVTGKSADEMERFADKANKTAKQLGAATKEYSDASLIYYQQGLSDEESAARTETTIKTANVTGQSAEEVSEQLTAVWNGYKVNAQEAELYVDKLAAVAATTASDLEELSTGMSKVASAANSMGVNVDQLNAQLATIVSVTRQAPESVGTALKTIFARMGDLAVEGADEFGVSLGEVSSKMQQMGIQILDQQGNLRDMGIVIEETALKWDTWTEAQKQAAAVAMAGKRQYNNLIALFDNWDMYTEALNTSQNSLGTLQEQQDIYMESTEAHLQRMKTAWEDVYDSMLDKDTVNNFADLWGGVGNIFSTLIDGLGGGGESLLLLSSILMSVFSKQLASSISGFIANIDNAKYNAEQLAEKMMMIDKVGRLENIDDGTKKIAEMEKVLMSLTGVMSEAQINMGQMFIKQQDELYKSKEAMDSLKQSTLDYYEEVTGEKLSLGVDSEGKNIYQDTAGNTVDVEDMQDTISGNINEATDWDIEDSTAKIKELNSATQEYIQTKKDYGDASTQAYAAEEKELDAQIAAGQAVSDLAKHMHDLDLAQRLPGESGKKLTQINKELDKTLDELGVSIEQALESAEGRRAIDDYVKKLGKLQTETRKTAKEMNDSFDYVTTQKADAEIEALEQNVRDFHNYIQEFKNTLKAQDILGTVSAVGQLSSSLMTISNLPNIWQNQDLSTGEKFLQILTNIGFAVPMAIASIQKLIAPMKMLSAQQALSNVEKLKDINLTKAKNIEDLKSVAIQALVNKGETEENAILMVENALKGVNIAQTILSTIVKTVELAVTILIKIVTGELTIAMFGLQVPLIALIAIIGAVAGIIYALVKAQNKEEDAAKKAAENAKKMAEAYNEVKQAFDDMKSAIDAYNESLDALQNLTKGTEEYDKAVQELNADVLELIDKYPALISAIQNVDGVLTLDPEKANDVLDSYYKQMQATYRTKLQAEIESAEADKDLQLKDYKLTYTYERTQYDRSNKATTGTETATISDDNLEDIVDAINEDGLEILQDEKYLTNIVGLNSTLAKSIVGNESLQIKLAEAAEATRANTEAIKLYREQEAANYLQNNLTGDTKERYDNLESSEQNLVNILVANSAENLDDDTIKDKYEMLQGNKDDAALHEEYANIMGYDAEKIDDKAGGAKFTKDGTTYTDKVSDKEMKKVVMKHKKMEMAAQQTDEYINSVNNIQSSAGGQETVDFLGNGSLNFISPEQVEKAAAVSKEVFEANQAVFAAKGYDTYEAYVTAFNKSIENYDPTPYFEGIISQAEKNIETTSDAIESLDKGEELSEEQIAALNSLAAKYDVLNQVRDKGTQEYINALKEIRELEEKEKIDATIGLTKAAYDNATEALDAWETGSEKGAEQVQKMQSEIDALFDANYELDMSLTNDLLSDVENIVTMAEGAQTAVSLIGEGFKVAAKDSKELFKVFPELAESATILADGTIQLDDEVTNKVLQNNGIKIDDNKRVTAAAIKERINELDLEIKAEEAELESVKQGALDKGKLQSILNTMKTDMANSEVEKSEDVAADEVANDAASTEAIIKNWAAKEGAALDYAKTIRELPQRILSGDFSKNIDSSKYTITSEVKTQNTTKDNTETTEKDELEILRQQVEAALEDSIASKKKQRADLVSAYAQMNYETTEGIKEADKSNDKEIKFLEDEKDLYHDINIEIQQLENSMEELQSQQDKLYGQDLLNNLQKQLDLLEKQEDAQRRKLEIAKQEAATLKSTLAGQGTTFNADGTITNYHSLYDQKLAYVNSIIASGDEDAADAAQKAFEAWVENVERYDELISSEIPEIDQTIRDMMDERIEKQIEAFEYEITLKLDMKDAERDWNDFKKNMTIDEDDILGSARFSFNNLGTYLSNDGTIATLTDQSNTLLDQLAQMNATGTSSIYGDNRAALMEDIAENQDALMAAMEEQKDLLDEIEQAYFDMLDAAQEAFDEQVAQYEAINEVYSHGLNVINVLYGEDAYAEMEGFYQSTIENTNDLISFQAKQVQMWKEKLNDPSLTDEQRDEIQKKMQEAQAAVLSSVETQLDNIINKYTNAINKIFKELEDKMTGGKGLSYIQEEWDLLNKNADMYLDQVNSAYEVEKLAREYNKAIDATDSLSAQRKLNELMEEQLKGLREKEKLTQYDVDRANALLDIELKRIALEEAQQNKSKMRLRRDASGNYSYQFVSDEDATAQAQQELADAQNSLYNLDKDAYKENLDAIVQLEQEFTEKYAEVMLDTTLTEEERQAKRLLLEEQYNEMMNNLLAQNTALRINLEDTALQEMSNLNQSYLMEDLIPGWNSGVQEMASFMTGEGGLLPTCADSFAELSGVTQQYITDLDTLEAVAGVDLSNVAGYTDAIVNSMTPVLENNDELIDKYNEEIRLMGELQIEAQTLAQTYDAITTAAMAAVDAMLAARKTEADIDAEKAAQEAAAQQQAANEAAAAAQQQAAQQPSLAVGTGVTVKTTATHFSRDGGNGTRMKSFVPGSSYAVMQVSGNEVLIGRGGVATGWVNKTDLVGFKTGGYTGDWADAKGRLAVLHQKELVLNSKDTQNILRAVDVVRQIDGIMSSIMGNAFNKINNQINGLNSISFPVGGPTSSEAAVAQHIEINADFPGVEKASEIISAFENLTNMATQYAFKTDR